MSAPLALGPRAGPTLDSFFNPVLVARGGIRLAVLYSDAHPVHRDASVQALRDAGRQDLIPGVLAYYDFVAAHLAGQFRAEREAWVTAVKLLIPPEVVSLMNAPWKQELIGNLAYYFPKQI